MCILNEYCYTVFQLYATFECDMFGQWRYALPHRETNVQCIVRSVKGKSVNTLAKYYFALLVLIIARF